MFHKQSGITKVQLLAALSIAILLGIGAAFWVGSRNEPVAAAPKEEPAAPPVKKTDEDRQLIEKQKVCLVSGEKLGSMGEPYRMEVEGQVVFVCCKGCVSSLQKDPKKYLAKLK
jgi:hypothetical protein